MYVMGCEQKGRSVVGGWSVEGVCLLEETVGGLLRGPCSQKWGRQPRCFLWVKCCSYIVTACPGDESVKGEVVRVTSLAGVMAGKG